MIPGKSHFPYLPLRNRSPRRVRTEAAFKSLESSAGRLKIQAFLLNESYPPYLKGFLFFNSTWGAGRERKIVQGLSQGPFPAGFFGVMVILWCHLVSEMEYSSLLPKLRALDRRPASRMRQASFQ